MSMAITYNNLYLDIRQIFKEAGMEASTLEARELVCYTSGKTRQQFFRDSALYVSEEVERQVRSLVRRHLAGEPVAYLIGEWEFYGLPLDISESVLIPRSDTEVLVEKALPQLQALGPCRILDLCAGSGCIGLALATHVPQARVVLGEISEGALRVCRQNIRRSNLSGRVAAVRADALEKPARTLGEFDCIVCNPPYIPHDDIPGLDVSVRDYEPHLALDGGTDGLDFYRSVCTRWREAMTARGTLFFEVGIGQADRVGRLMLQNGFGDLDVAEDTAGIPRVVWGRIYHEI